MVFFISNALVLKPWSSTATTHRGVEEPQADAGRHHGNGEPTEVPADVAHRVPKLTDVMAIDDVLEGQQQLIAATKGSLCCTNLYQNTDQWEYEEDANL